MPTRDDVPDAGAEDANSPAQNTTGDSLAGVLDRLVEFVSWFLWTQSDHQLNAIALWIVHTFLIDEFDVTPYLEISAPEKRCGKTRLLELLDLLCHDPVFTVNISTAAMFRLAPERPTFLIDESDAIFGRGGDEDKRAFINSGYKRGAVAVRVGGPPRDLKPEFFDTYCCKALAGIGNLPDTVSDRSIPIRLQRKPPSVPLERFRLRDLKAHTTLGELQVDIAAVAETHQASIGACYPFLPDELHDRAQEIWEPLLAIAEVAGGPWPKEARAAAIALHTSGEEADGSVAVLLLSDIRDVFGDDDRLATRDLLDRLYELDEAPWGDWYGKPITARFLATKLKPFQVRSKTIRIGEATSKGYEKSAFLDAWERYLPVTGVTDVTTDTAQGKTGETVNVTMGNSEVTRDLVTHVLPIVTDSKTAENPYRTTIVTDVTDVTPTEPTQNVIDDLNAEVVIESRRST
jgi:hypothetical protein